MAATALAAVLFVRTREPAHSRSRRGVLFGVLVGACVLAAAVAVALGISGREDNGAVSAGGRARRCPSAQAANRPTVVFRSLGASRRRS